MKRVAEIWHKVTEHRTRLVRTSIFLEFFESARNARGSYWHPLPMLCLSDDESSGDACSLRPPIHTLPFTVYDHELQWYLCSQSSFTDPDQLFQSSQSALEVTLNRCIEETTTWCTEAYLDGTRDSPTWRDLAIGLRKALHAAQSEQEQCGSQCSTFGFDDTETFMTEAIWSMREPTLYCNFSSPIARFINVVISNLKKL